MKKLSILFFLLLLSAIGFAQETEEEVNKTEKQKTMKIRKAKIDIAAIPNTVLNALKESYAKHFVMKAFKTNNNGLIYHIELQKNRKWFTVAINDQGRVIKEIHKEPKNAVADLN